MTVHSVQDFSSVGPQQEKQRDGEHQARGDRDPAEHALPGRRQHVGGHGKRGEDADAEQAHDAHRGALEHRRRGADDR